MTELIITTLNTGTRQIQGYKKQDFSINPIFFIKHHGFESSECIQIKYYESATVSYL